MKVNEMRRRKFIQGMAATAVAVPFVKSPSPNVETGESITNNGLDVVAVFDGRTGSTIVLRPGETHYFKSAG